MNESIKNNSGKRLQGEVVKLSSEKTIKVRVEIKKPHPMYGKIVKKHNSYLVHSDDPKVAVGDIVQIEESKPISKSKKFVLVKRISK